MSEQRVDHGRTGGHVSLDQIEVFRVSLELWSAASCRTFAGRHGANVRTGQGSGRRLAATKSVRNKYPKLLGGGRRTTYINFWCWPCRRPLLPTRFVLKPWPCSAACLVRPQRV